MGCTNAAIAFVLVLHITFCCFVLTGGWLFSNDNRCYRHPNVGCFPIDDPYGNSMGFPPESPNDLDVHLIFRSFGRPVRFPLRDTRRAMQNRYNPEVKTVVLIHGFMEDPNRRWVNRMVTELKRMPGSRINIFVLDWRHGANDINYFQCVANARMAGALTALFILDLMALGASPGNVHLIGFSLGAHVAGYVGRRVRGIGRITGLDPAGPQFEGTHHSVRLDGSDAIVVDVVHTSSDLGTMRPSGTIDFYPNGGADQPSCATGTIDRLRSFVASLEFSRRSVTRAFSCSHQRATDLYIASVNNPCFFQTKRFQSIRDVERDRGSWCRTGACPTFGYHFNSSHTGLHGLHSSGTYPFC